MKALFSLILSFILFSPLYAQRPTKDIDVLLIHHLTKDKVKYFEKGDKLSYWIKESKGRHKSHLDSFGDGFILCDGQYLSFDTISKVSGRSMGMAVLNTTGKVLIVSGTGITGIGAGMIIKSGQTQDACQALGYVIGGIISGTAGLAIVVVGLVPTLVHQKRYKLYKNWYLDTGTVSVKMSRKELKKAGLL